MQHIRNLAITLCLLVAASNPLSAKSEERAGFQTWLSGMERALDRGIMYEKGHREYGYRWTLGDPIVLLDTDAAAWDKGSPKWQQRAIHFFACEATRWRGVQVHTPLAVQVRVRKLMDEKEHYWEKGNPWFLVYPWLVKTVFEGTINTCS